MDFEEGGAVNDHQVSVEYIAELEGLRFVDHREVVESALTYLKHRYEES